MAPLVYMNQAYSLSAECHLEGYCLD